jgi:putative ABC transport system permease protein
MKTLALSWHYLWSRPLGAALNIVLLSLGLSSITFLLLVGYQLTRAFDKDLAGVDVVVGAKGSPMQLIFSGLLQIDVPPGNVSLKAVNALRADPMVASLLPISLGDNLAGFRIVGTSHAYIDHYGAKLAQGRLWDAPMQVVLGAAVAKKLGLPLGAVFAGSHGLAAGGHAHGDTQYRVVGILQASGSVIDRVIVTDTASVWQVHEAHGAHDAPAAANDKEVGHEDHGDHAGHEDHAAHEGDASHAAPQADDGAREVTMALIQYKTPLAAMVFPRKINTTTEMQAAAPAVEIARLLNMLGIGTDVLRAFAAVLLLTAGLSVFIALWSAVRERRSDLALLRMLGASPRKIVALLLGEAFWLGALSALLGLAGGQALTALIGWMLQLDNSLLIGGLVWPVELLWIPALACGVALAAAILPAMGAYRVGVWALLQAR